MAVDQTRAISPCRIQYLYKLLDPTHSGECNSLPWRLGLITQNNSSCQGGGALVWWGLVVTVRLSSYCILSCIFIYPGIYSAEAHGKIHCNSQQNTLLLV